MQYTIITTSYITLPQKRYEVFELEMMKFKLCLLNFHIKYKLSDPRVGSLVLQEYIMNSWYYLRLMAKQSTKWPFVAY